jgi:hypothetical protein
VKGIKDRHDEVAKVIYSAVTQNHQIEDSVYRCKPRPVVRQNSIKLLWDCLIPTRDHIAHRRPDIVLFDYKRKIVSIVDVAVCWETEKAHKRAFDEKVLRYEQLRVDLVRQLRCWKVRSIPIVIGSLGSYDPERLNNSLRDLLPGVSNEKLEYVRNEMQRVVVLGSVRVAKTHLAER